MTAQTFPRFRLAHDQARQLATAAVWRAPEGWTVDIKPPRRSLDQNAAFHAMLTEISKSGVAVCGEAGRDTEDLKTIFVSLWMRLKERPSAEVTGLDGEPVQLRRSTTTFSKSEMSELIECTAWWASSHGIVFKDPASTRTER